MTPEEMRIGSKGKECYFESDCYTDFPAYSDTGKSDTRPGYSDSFDGSQMALHKTKLMWLEWHLLTVTLFSCPEGVTVSGDVCNQILSYDASESFYGPRYVNNLNSCHWGPVFCIFPKWEMAVYFWRHLRSPWYFVNHNLCFIFWLVFLTKSCFNDSRK